MSRAKLRLITGGSIVLVAAYRGGSDNELSPAHPKRVRSDPRLHRSPAIGQPEIPLTLEFVTTLSNLLTLGLLLSGAIAAVVQFRHVRMGNELAAVLAIDRSFAEPELQSALLYVQEELADKLAQREYRAQLAARGYVDPKTHPEMAVCNWFNEMGALVVGKFVSEDLFLDSYGRLVEYNWRLLGPAIALLRRERGPGQYANFELLAELAGRWRANHRAGLYPPGLPRLPVTDPWATADRAAGAGAGRP